MNIEIVMQNSAEREIVPDSNQIVVDNPVVADNPVVVDTLEDTTKQESQSGDIDYSLLSGKLINDICNYLTEHTEFLHMRDEIINGRVRQLMAHKYTPQIIDILINLHEFIENDEVIQNYIKTNANIDINVDIDTNIDKELYTNIYDKIYEDYWESSDVALNMARGWLDWDVQNGRFSNNSSFDLDINDELFSVSCKYVFQQYGNIYALWQKYNNLTHKTIKDDNSNTDVEEEEDEKENEEDEEEDVEDEDVPETSQELNKNTDCSIF